MGSKGPDERTVTQETTIPGFLQPFINNSTGVAGGALSSLQGLLGGNTVAGFTRDQNRSFDLTRALAGGAGGVLPTALNTFLNTAQGGAYRTRKTRMKNK